LKRLNESVEEKQNARKSVRGEEENQKSVLDREPTLGDVMSIYVDNPWYTADSHLEESWFTVEIDFS
jgi:hypothetical protein